MSDNDDLSIDGRYIMTKLLPEWEERFRAKQRDYGNDANQLGLSGAFVDVWRKAGKLKRALWDGQKLVGEQPREILMDLVGHCFLIIAQMDSISHTKEHASDPAYERVTE